MFTQRFIRSIIEEVWNQTPDGNGQFYNALVTGRSGNWSKTSTGWQVESSAGAGYHTSFHIPSSPADTNNLTPARLQDLFQQLVEYYRVVVSNGTQEDNNVDAGSSPFVAAMQALFPTIKGITQDYSYIAP